MPIYTVKDTKAGKTIKFNWTGTAPPTDEDMTEIFSKAESVDVPQWRKAVSTVGRSTFELGGMAAGSMLGGAATLPTGPGALYGTVVGGALGFTIGKKVGDVLDAALGMETPNLTEGITEVPSLLATGAAMEVGGQVAGKIVGSGLGAAIRLGGKVLGRLSGTGYGAIAEAAKGSEKFRAAMRGNISGSEIVGKVKEALQEVKDLRGLIYRKQLADISQNQTPIDMTPINNKLTALMNTYNVKVNPKGEVDISRIAMSRRGRSEILGVIKTVAGWNKAGDSTAVGLDVLKRQLDDFYSQSSQSRAFVQSLRDTVRGTITKAVPKYGEMTKGYSDITRFIKDVEAGLALRSQGTTNRFLADRTLRKLMSAMREDSGLKKELLDLLGAKAGEELSQQVAGYTMRGVLPVGSVGTGPVIIGGFGLAKILGPAFYPVLMLSSPRVAGEFIQALGRTSAQMGKFGVEGLEGMVPRVGAYALAKSRRDSFIPPNPQNVNQEQ